MEKIQDFLEKQITRGNCATCPRLKKDDLGDLYEVTEERIGSGNEYCEVS